MISISYLKLLCKACNTASVNHVTSARQYLWGSVWKRVKTIVDATMPFTKVISKFSQYNIAALRKNLNSTKTTFAECCHKFRGLHLKTGDFVKVASGAFKDYYTVVTGLSYVHEIEMGHSSQGHLRLSMKFLQFLWNFHHSLLSMRKAFPENSSFIPITSQFLWQF